MRVKRIVYSVLLAGALMFCFGTTAFASENWAGITAVLKANQSTINSSYNYHSLTLTGKNGLDTVKGCVGYGYVDMD